MLGYTEVKQDIIKGSLRPFYIFTGEERYVLHKYVEKIGEVSGRVMQTKDSVAMCARGKTSSLLAKDACYVVYDDKDFTTNEKVWDGVADLLGNNILILILSTIDKRSKFYKHFEDSIVTFAPLNKVILEQYVRAEVDLCNSYTDYLIDICENDCNRIFSEIDKIKRVNAKDDNEAFDILLDDNAIYIPPKDVIFDFADAILSKNIKKSFSLLDECLAQGEAPLRLITVIYNNLKWLLQVQGCTDTKDLEQTTGLLFWQIRAVKDHCGVYTNRGLVRALEMVHSVEKGVKTGDIDPIMAVSYILVELFR